MHATKEHRAQVMALEAGAHGYMMKSHDFDELNRAIEQILGGGTYLSPRMAQIAAQGGRPSSVLERLTEIATGPRDPISLRALELLWDEEAGTIRLGPRVGLWSASDLTTLRQLWRSMPGPERRSRASERAEKSRSSGTARTTITASGRPASASCPGAR